MAKSSYGTTVKTGMSMKSTSTSGIRHGKSVPNGAVKSAPRSHLGRGSKNATGPIKGADRGGAK